MGDWVDKDAHLFVDQATYEARVAERLSRQIDGAFSPQTIHRGRWADEVRGRVGRLWTCFPFILTPSRWRAMRGEAIDGDEDAVEEWADWQRAMTLTPVEPWGTDVSYGSRGERPTFPSVEVALKVLVETREDGYYQGSIGDAHERLAKLGCTVQVGGKTDPRGVYDAERCAEVERCLPVAFDDHNSHGLPLKSCLTILFARVIGPVRKSQILDEDETSATSLAERYGISKSEVGTIVKSGMRRLRVEFAARGLTPMPHPRRGLAEQIERRRAELGVG